MRRYISQPSSDAEARLLLLIDAFSKGNSSLEGRTKLAKLDFFLRYPTFLKRGLAIRNASALTSVAVSGEGDIEDRMIRYRYGPWDPSYFSLLGRLIGKELVVPVRTSRGIGFKATSSGRDIASQIAATEEWRETAERTKLLKRHFDLSGTSLKEFVYRHFPEVSEATWGDKL